ncbi:MAG TPA: 3-hydroxyacyl-CoA dehydrogenase family protein [Candidatus Baltobacteraceae bacterium]|nr:3-hydroxyacyl-CoA dehydrogenase family protein [Candidatus Baltobacteraceae bacterium]
MEIRSVGIVGTGLMGMGIARLVARAGIPVTIVKWSPGPLEDRRAAFIRSIEKERDDKKSVTAEEAARIIHGVQWTLATHPLESCDLVIESIVEDEDQKLDCFRKLDAVMKPDAILATNTSTLDVLELARETSRAPQVLGMHFFNPVALMALVEIAVTDLTDLATAERAFAFASSLGKEPVVVGNAPGFVVNRLLMASCMEAVRMAFEARPRVADIKAVDRCVRLGLAHPKGPFELMDLIGLDVILAMAESLQEGLRNAHYAPPLVLADMVAEGWFGQKSGIGFYDYREDRKNPRPNADIERLLRGR